MTNSYIPILIMLIIAAGMGAVFLSLNWFLGRHQRNPAKLAPYESGVPLLDESRKRVNVRFYQIAMLFILFDIEVVLLFQIAVELEAYGWFALGETVTFIGLLAVAFVYVWRRGALEWR